MKLEQNGRKFMNFEQTLFPSDNGRNDTLVGDTTNYTVITTKITLATINNYFQ